MFSFSENNFSQKLMINFFCRICFFSLSLVFFFFSFFSLNFAFIDYPPAEIPRSEQVGILKRKLLSSRKTDVKQTFQWALFWTNFRPLAIQLLLYDHDFVVIPKLNQDWSIKSYQKIFLDNKTILSEYSSQLEMLNLTIFLEEVEKNNSITFEELSIVQQNSFIALFAKSRDNAIKKISNFVNFLQFQQQLVWKKFRKLINNLNFYKIFHIKLEKNYLFNFKSLLNLSATSEYSMLNQANKKKLVNLNKISAWEEELDNLIQAKTKITFNSQPQDKSLTWVWIVVSIILVSFFLFSFAFFCKHNLKKGYFT